MSTHLQFPADFIFGTSTSAGQIETAFDHAWEGMKTYDGHIFRETTEHEKHVDSDIEIIAGLAPHYRMSLMWSKLQPHAYAPLLASEVLRYRYLMTKLKERGVTVMLVIDHWVHPRWFNELGGWAAKASVGVWVDFASKLISEFGEFVDFWNTFNEPNLFTTFSTVLGEFPPFKKNILSALFMIRNMNEAHEHVYEIIKTCHPHAKVGVSYNTVYFESNNLLGVIPARIAKWWYQDFLNSFFRTSDFTGISYYARLAFDPFPVTALYTPEKIARLGRESDDIWDYYPAGLAAIVRDFWAERKKPVIITENGICTSDDSKRIRAISDYMGVLHGLLQENIPIIGYYHWSTWDNFEWTLGPTFKFGLYHCDPVTKVRKEKPSAAYYRELAFSRQLRLC